MAEPMNTADMLPEPIKGLEELEPLFAFLSDGEACAKRAIELIKAEKDARKMVSLVAPAHEIIDTLAASKADREAAAGELADARKTVDRLTREAASTRQVIIQKAGAERTETLESAREEAKDMVETGKAELDAFRDAIKSELGDLHRAQKALQDNEKKLAADLEAHLIDEQKLAKERAKFDKRLAGFDLAMKGVKAV